MLRKKQIEGVIARAYAYEKACKESGSTDTGTLWELLFDMVHSAETMLAPCDHPRAYRNGQCPDCGGPVA